MKGVALCPISDAYEGNGENAFLVADNGKSGAQLYGNLFVAHKLFDAFVHASHKDLIMRKS